MKISRRSSSRRKRQRRQPTPTATSIAITTHRISSSLILTLPSSLLLAIIIFITTLCTPTCHSFSLPSSSSSSSSSSSPPSPPPPPFHNPSTPEEAVQNQLHYYQTYQLNRAYQCCSPSNREATGGIDEFERLLKEPPYDLIVGHQRADVLLEVVPGDNIILSLNENGEESESGMLDDHGNVVCCLVCIRPNGKARKKYPVWFWWEMSKMGQIMELEEEEDTMTRNEWMVDSIMPDFEDLDFETESLSIEDFGEEEDGDDGDDLTIYWDFDE